MIVALTRPTGPELSECELTHIERDPIDMDRAIEQHDRYLDVLRTLDVEVHELPRLEDHPDAVFVEDTTVVLDEVAVMLRPGAASRRGEVASVESVLRRFRPIVTMTAPATLDGGDVIVFGKRILVGETTRSSRTGIEALADLVRPYGYTVEGVPVQGVLHLKSAATVVDDETLIHYPAYVDLSFLGGKLLEAHPDEPQGANVVEVGAALLADGSSPRTLEVLRTHSTRQLIPVHVDEFAKAEGAISCKGVIFTA